MKSISLNWQNEEVIKLIEGLRRKFSRIDLRLVLVLNNTTLVVFGIFFLDLQRTINQYAFCIGLAAFLEFVLQFYKRKEPGVKLGWNFVWNRVVSASATAMGCLLALNIPDFWWYAFPIGLSVFSKVLVCRPDGSHIYNPSNFGIVMSLLLLPDHKVYFLPDQFASSLVPLLQALIVGIVVNIWVKRYWQIISYLACTAIMAFLFSSISGFNFALLSGPDYNALSIIYLMFMISDPKTSPSKIPEQVIFGCTIAVVTVFLRWYGGIAHQIIGLFVASSLFFIVESLRRRLASSTVPGASSILKWQ